MYYLMSIYVAKTKVLISCKVNFVFAYVESKFSHDDMDLAHVGQSCWEKNIPKGYETFHAQLICS